MPLVQLSSLAGTPFHAVCAFRGLGPVALLVFPACPLRVRALALSRRPRPPPLPGSVWRAHLARSRCWAPVGQFHAVRVPPRVLPWSCALFGLLGGGAARSRSPSARLGVVCPPSGRPARPGRSGPGGAGGGGGLCALLPGGAAGGPRGAGGCPTSVRPSAFLVLAAKRVSLASLWSWRAWPPYCSGSCSRVVPGRGPCGVLVRWRGLACLSQSPWEQVGGGVGARGVRAQLRPLPGRCGPFGGRGDVPSACGGVEGWRLRGQRAGGGEWGERGGEVTPWFPTSLLRGGGLWPPAQSPLLRRCITPKYTCSAGVLRQPSAPGAT